MLCASGFVVSAEKHGIYELVHRSSNGYEETLTAVADALQESNFSVHTRHEVKVPNDAHSAHVFVLTSPAYRTLAEAESPRTISAQVLRVAVYTWGDNLDTMVNIANPVAQAMVFYAKSDNYDALVKMAEDVAGDIRATLSTLPGESVQIPQSPMRTEKHYRKFKGDGPARMMARFRTFQKSQLVIHEIADKSVNDIANAVVQTLRKTDVSDASKSVGWEPLVQIPFSKDAVYIGVTNPYIENKMIRINSRFRSDGKFETAPFPGVDHVSALPNEILVIREEVELHHLRISEA